MTKDVILRNVDKKQFAVYKYDGYFARILSMADYFKYSMELISNAEARRALFSVRHRPILTKVRNSEPTYYSEGSEVRNSLIADGCEIEGTVENSIIFRGVKVSRNATVRNCILMQDTYVGEGSYVNCVISDKNSRIKDSRLLSGTEEAPYYIRKHQTV